MGYFNRVDVLDWLDCLADVLDRLAVLGVKRRVLDWLAVGRLGRGVLHWHSFGYLLLARDLLILDDIDDLRLLLKLSLRDCVLLLLRINFHFKAVLGEFDKPVLFFAHFLLAAPSTHSNTARDAEKKKP